MKRFVAGDSGMIQVALPGMPVCTFRKGQAKQYMAFVNDWAGRHGEPLVVPEFNVSPKVLRKADVPDGINVVQTAVIRTDGGVSVVAGYRAFAKSRDGKRRSRFQSIKDKAEIEPTLLDLWRWKVKTEKQLCPE